MALMNYPTRKGKLFYEFLTRPSVKPLLGHNVSTLTPNALIEFNVPKHLNQYEEALTRGIRHVIAKIEPVNRPRRLSITVTALIMRKDGDNITYNLYGQRIANGRDREAPIVAPGDDINAFVQNSLKTAVTKIEESALEGSGWTIVGYPYIITRSGQYSAAAGMWWKALPPVLQSYISKKRIVNIQNKDNECFKWCIVAYLAEMKRNPTRLAPLKKWLQNHKCADFSKLTYPVSLDAIPQFSADNPHLPPIIVYEIADNLTKQMIDEGRGFHILQTPGNIPAGVEPIGLILHQGHYILAREPRLLTTHRPSHGRNFICYRHSQSFSSKERYKAHMQTCKNQDQVQVFLPEKGKHELFFGAKTTDWKKLVMSPYVCYADLETLSGDKSSTVSSFAYNIVSTHKDAPHQVYRSFNGVGCLIRGLQQLSDDAHRICYEVQSPKPMIITPEQEETFKNATTCWICEKELHNDRVRDHDHLSGLYRGPAHNACNLNLNVKGWKLPVWFHNGRGFDFHYIAPLLPQISKRFDPVSMTFEKITTITCDNMVFRDSLLHMKTSLAKWAEQIGELPHTKALFEGRYCEDAAELIVQKGYYPYEWVDDWSKFDETKLPPPEAFASKLSGSCGLTEEEHTQAVSVWESFDCETFQDYNDIYLAADVMLLTDCMEAYRAKAMKEYGIDPVHFCTAPSLAWTACMKKTGAVVESFTSGQQDMLEFAEASRRGGMVNAITRSVKTRDCDSTMYIDANNLYGWAMKQELPTGGYEWVEGDWHSFTPEQLTDFVMALPTGGDTGFLLEVDIHCPPEHHDKFNDLPLFPEGKPGTPSDFMCKHYPSEIRPVDKRTPKLIADLTPKKKYGTDIRMLQFAIRHGYVLTAVHRILRYDQKKWMEIYINFNTEQRNFCKKHGDEVGSALFKLLNNAIYGKCCENVRKRANISTVSHNNDRKMEQQFSHPHTKTWRHFVPEGGYDGDGYTAFIKEKTRVTIDKPVLVGVAILELSKLLMYKAWYEEIKPRNPTAKLVYMDTDSFIIHKAGTPEEPAKIDFGNLMDKNVLGKFKDECKGKRIQEVVALRAKTYSVVVEGGEDIRKAKGSPAKAKFKTGGSLSHQHYVDAVQQREVPDVVYNTLESRYHLVSMRTVTKKSLGAYDDKRWVLDNGIDTLAHGHYRIVSKQSN